MPVVGELVAGGMPQHVRVAGEWKLCGLPGPGDYFQESRCRSGTASFGDKNVSRFISRRS
jgi:hypothetical protein